MKTTNNQFPEIYLTRDLANDGVRIVNIEHK